jgi:hypothetical protein
VCSCSTRRGERFALARACRQAWRGSSGRREPDAIKPPGCGAVTAPSRSCDGRNPARRRRGGGRGRSSEASRAGSAGASLPRGSIKAGRLHPLIETPRFAVWGSQPASDAGCPGTRADQRTKTITTMTTTATTTAMPILRGVMWRLRRVGTPAARQRALGLPRPYRVSRDRRGGSIPVAPSRWRAAHCARGCARGAGPPPALGRPVRRAWSSPRSMSPRRKPSPA